MQINNREDYIREIKHIDQKIKKLMDKKKENAVKLHDENITQYDSKLFKKMEEIDMLKKSKIRVPRSLIEETEELKKIVRKNINSELVDVIRLLNEEIHLLLEKKNKITNKVFDFNVDNMAQSSVFDPNYDDTSFENIKIGLSEHDKLFSFLSKGETSPSVVIPVERFPSPDVYEKRGWERRFMKNNSMLDAINNVRNYIRTIPTIRLRMRPIPDDIENYEPTGEENPYELLGKYRNINTKISRGFKWVMLVKSLPQFNCSTCWSEFIRQRAYVDYLSLTRKWREYLYIIPNLDSNFSTTENKVDKIFSKENFMVTFQLGEQFLALTLRDIFMIDFDFKDEISEKQIDNMLRYVVNIAHHAIGIKIAFFKIRTDRGVHIFLMSDYVDFENMLWIDLMLKMCSDSWYAAFANSRGWAIRLNGKKGKKGERVADPNFSLPPSDILLPENIKIGAVTDISSSYLKHNLNFRSAYFGKRIDLKYFVLGDVMKLVIGYKESVNQKIFSMIVFHYLLIEYFRDIVGENAKEFECQLFNKILGYDPQGNYTKDDVEELKKLIEANGSIEFFPLNHDASLEKKSRKYVRIDPVYEYEYENFSEEQLDTLNIRFEREMQTIEGLREDIKFIYEFTVIHQNYLVLDSSQMFRQPPRSFLRERKIS